MTSPISIQKMEKDDLPAIHVIELLAHPAPWSYNLLIEEWKKQKHSFSFTAEHTVENQIVGYSFCWGWDGVDMTISNIAVHPSARRQGTGTLLLKNMIDTAKNEKCISVILEVRESNNNAVSLYRKLGFEAVGKRRDYYRSPKEDGLIMRLPLTSTNHTVIYKPHC